MARNRFGGDAATWFVQLDSTGAYRKPKNLPVLTLWSGDPDDLDRVMYDDLRAIDDPTTVINSITGLANGTTPEFFGPDDESVTRMWISSDGGVTGTWITTTTLSKAAASGQFADLEGTPAIPSTAADVGAVPTTRKVNGKPLSADVTLAAGDVGAATAAQGAKADSAVQPADMASKLDASKVGAAGGVAPLDGSQKLPEANVPDRLSQVQLAAAFVGAARTSLSFLPVVATRAAETVRPIDVLADGDLYGVNGTVINRSADHGDTWTVVQDMGAGDQIVAIRDTGDGEVIVSRYKDGLYRSTGWGSNPATATWAKVTQPSGSGAYFAAFGLSVNPDTGLVAVAEYAGTYTDSKVVRLSTDHGRTFSVIFDLYAAGVTADPDNCHIHIAEIDPWANDRIWIAWHHNSTVGVGGTFYSDDRGATWVNVTTKHPVTATATDRGIVFGSDDPGEAVAFIDRDDATMQYKVTLAWRENVNGALPGFAFQGRRDPATGVVYVGCTTYQNAANGQIIATDGPTAAVVWRNTDVSPGDSQGIHHLTVSGSRLLAQLITGSTNETLTAPVPLRGPRTPSSDDPGAVLGGKTSTWLGTAAGVGASAADKALASGMYANAGANATAVGYRASATGAGAVALGQLTSATGAACVAIGQSVGVSGDASVGIGYGAVAAISDVAIGLQAIARNNSVVIGKTANIAAGFSTSVVIGWQALGHSTDVVLGGQAQATADHAVAVGHGAVAGHTQAVALGYQVATTAANQVAIGANHIELKEIAADPAAPAADTARMYVKDDGAGNTILCVRTSAGVKTVTMA